MSNNNLPNYNTANTSKESPKLSKEQAETQKILRKENVDTLKNELREILGKLLLTYQFLKIAVKHFLLITGIILLWIYFFQPEIWDQIMLHAMRSKQSTSMTHQIGNLVKQEFDTIKTGVHSAISDITKTQESSFKTAAAVEIGKLAIALCIAIPIVLVCMKAGGYFFTK